MYQVYHPSRDDWGSLIWYPHRKIFTKRRKAYKQADKIPLSFVKKYCPEKEVDYGKQIVAD